MQGAGVADWEENCIEVMVGGPQSGWGSHSSTPPVTPPPPPPPPIPRPMTAESADDSSSMTYVLLVLILVGGAAGYVAKDKGLGPFADGGAGGASLVSATAKADSTIYDTGGDETL